MIGQVWPVASTGYSVLQSGEINRQTLQLDIQGYLVADPRGNTFAASYGDLVSAMAAATAFATSVPPAFATGVHKSDT